MPFPRSDVTYSVRAGSPWIDQITKTTIDTLAKEVIVHSRYRASRYWSWIGRANDIALLNLERPLQYSKYVWPICLPGLDYSVKDYSLCTVTGWGLPRVGGESKLSYPQQGGWCGIEPGCRPGSTMDRYFCNTFPREPTTPLLSDSYLFFPLRASAVNVSRGPRLPLKPSGPSQGV